MYPRIQKLRKLFSKNNIDAFLVTKDVNIRYLTNFSASESWLLITPRKIFYITDFRYILEVEKGLKKGIEIIQYQTSFYHKLTDLLNKEKVKRLGIDERHFTHAQYKAMVKILPKTTRLVEANELVEQLRVIKEKYEILQIKKALEIHDLALKFLKRIVKPGKTENEVFRKLENFIKEHNVGFSFAPIIASGVNACFPHAHVTQRVIKNNEPVLIDMGIDFNGYKSDLTRMFFLGKIAPHIRDAAEAVREAQQRAIKVIRAGISAAEVDAQARKYLEEKGLAQYFGHALGHGVGLEIHEDPRLSQKNSSILKEGMVITVEPAVYIPHKFGIRIEDMVLVTKKGCKILSDYID
ncbi:MAG: aminopeptidase P family protein [Candidatus Omnitrophica bacterium]|nr:aminopeptidase P family protein [Candidatus Omnitrophota bacterium]